VSLACAFPELADRPHDGEALLAALEPLIDRLVMDRTNQSKMRLSTRSCVECWTVCRATASRSDGRRLSGGYGRIGCAASAAHLTIAGRSGCAR
jgi:hypothetical protein